MSDTPRYNELLAEVCNDANQLHEKIKDFVPKMAFALKYEDPNLSVADIRDRIKKDCAHIWSIRRIIDAMPDEFKDKVKQTNRIGKKNIVIEESDDPRHQQTEEHPAIEVITGALAQEEQAVKREPINDTLVRENEDLNQKVNELSQQLEQQQQPQQQPSPRIEDTDQYVQQQERIEELEEALKRATEFKSASATYQQQQHQQEHHHHDDNQDVIIEAVLSVKEFLPGLFATLRNEHEELYLTIDVAAKRVIGYDSKFNRMKNMEQTTR